MRIVKRKPIFIFSPFSEKTIFPHSRDSPSVSLAGCHQHSVNNTGELSTFEAL
jgi:hypothetical protein